MSYNQSRGERTESSQHRKSGRSNLHRNFSGGGNKGSGGGGGPTAPPPSINNPSLPSNRSFKKHNNVQGGQPRTSTPSARPLTSDSNTHPSQNGAHAQQQSSSHGISDAQVSSSNVKPAAIKPTDMVPKATRAPRVPPSNASAASSDTKPPPLSVAPAKVPVEASKSFPLQFGSINPGLVNGMQVPARTSSAPPNLDEQKLDQARYNSLRVTPNLPPPSIPKQQLPRKDAGTLDQSSIAESHATVKPKREIPISAAAPVSQTQKPSVHPIQGMPMQMPFHQPQVPVKFGGPNPQIQPQAMSAASLSMAMPMSLTIGNQPVQQPMFVSGLQPHPHPMQAQGIIHQGQPLNFTSQMGPQLTPQMGNIGIGLGPQFPQQQAGKFGGQRKAVKITHPETHEELRLDGSPAPRSHPNMLPQSQPISSFPPAHAVNYYPNPNSYNASSLFYPTPSSIPLGSSHPPSQPGRLYNQVTVKPAASSHVEIEPASSVGSPRAAKAEPIRLSRPSPRESETFTQTVKPGPVPAPSSLSGTSKAPVSLGSDTLQSSAPDSSSPPVGVPPKGSSAARISGEGSRHEIVDVIDSGKVGQKTVVLDQAGGESTTDSDFQSQEHEAVGDKVPVSPATSVVPDIPKESASVALSPDEDVLDSICAEAEDSRASGSPKDFVGRVVENNQPEPPASEEQEVILPEEAKEDKGIESSLETSSSLNSSDRTEEKTWDAEHIRLEGPAGLSVKDDSSNDTLVARSTSVPDDGNVERVPSAIGKIDDNVKVAALDSSLSRTISLVIKEAVSTESSVADKESTSLSVSSHSEENSRREEGAENNNTGSVISLSIIKGRSAPETNVAKTAAPSVKKKRKELFKKLDNTAPTTDLYMAYKGPEEKKEAVVSDEGVENNPGNNLQPVSSHASPKNISNVKALQSKVEPDDWEDAADISTPKLETSKNESQIAGSGEDVNGTMTKKYSRDFLLKFAEQCTDIPFGFEFAPDVAEALMVSNVNVSRESYHNSGRVIERQNSQSRPDRRASGTREEDKWSKFPGPLMTGQDMRMDMGYGANVAGLRPGQVVNYGGIRNQRIQVPMQYPGGILGGPLPSPGPQIGMPRNSPDSERWQRGSAFQKGLMPSPHTHLQTMHKAERKYEIGKVTDEEQAKQRQLKGILNKLTPQNFEKLFEQVKQVNIDNDVTLTGVIAQIFDKALMEPTFCEMYANFCHHLAAELPDLSVGNEKITFKRLLLNKCQEEFERGEREEEEANKVEEEGEVKQSEEEREEKRIKARRKMLGNIRLIGELYKKKMLTERIMHECIKKLLGQYQNPDEENIEALCKLMSTIGEMIDHLKAKEHMDAYFDMMSKLSNNMKLSSRVRFMLKDSIDLRKNKWQQRRKVDGPKKIEEVHRDAAQERQAQTTRLARTPSMGSSIRRGQPMDFSPRGSNILASPNTHMAGYRSIPPQLRGYNAQDARMDERNVLDNRGLSVPLSQRPLGDESITLGPQGGLARGMSFRGQSTTPVIPLDLPSPADSRRMGAGLNGYNPISDRSAYNARDELLPRQMSERFSSAPVYDQSTTQERNMSFGSRDSRTTDRDIEKSLPSSPPARGGVQTFSSNVPPEKALSEDRLQEMSMSTIKEFYSAKDENEVALCIKDLNNPGFYPSMVSLWVIDSFERKDMERDLLASLLVNLTKSRGSMLNQDQLTRGFESVLMTLEDAVNDAPRAAEFLGRIFAKIILENIIPLHEIGQLIYEGGEEQGRLVEIGLAAEVLGTILEIITSEKGESVLTEIRSSSNLRLENFRPPGSSKSRRLDKFI